MPDGDIHLVQVDMVQESGYARPDDPVSESMRVLEGQSRYESR